MKKRKRKDTITFTGDAANDLFRSILKPEALAKFERDGKRLVGLKITGPLPAQFKTENPDAR